jgi:hypothetical protein
VEAPDYFEPTVGWRAWLVVQTPDGLRLSSVLYPTLWTPRQEEVAVCRPDAHGRDPADAAPHDAPHARCSCGIYASKTPDGATSYFHGTSRGPIKPLFRVMGTVALWGTIIEGARGYRASHAYPRRLYIPVNRAHRHRKVSPAQVAYELKTTYRVEVVPADISVAGEEAAIHAAAREV